MNKCIFIGRLGDNPTEGLLGSGESVVNFDLAINEYRKDKDGNKTPHTEWVRIVAYRNQADVIRTHLRKGDRVAVEGRMRTRRYEHEGVKRQVTEIVLSELEMLGSKREAGADVPEADTGTRVID
jgi:single-strand DNA-binding protein